MNNIWLENQHCDVYDVKQGKSTLLFHILDVVFVCFFPPVCKLIDFSNVNNIVTCCFTAPHWL